MRPNAELTDPDFARFMALSERADAMGYRLARNGSQSLPFVIRRRTGTRHDVAYETHDLDAVHDWLND